jgi:serine/threonine protein kinase
MKSKLTFESYSESYTVEDVPAEGGTGFVYKVKSGIGDLFALKLLKPEQIRKDRVSRFHQELLFCKAFDHKNILKVLDDGFMVCKDQKCPFYVMKYYPQTLRSILPIQTDDSSDALRFFSMILDGVEALHLRRCWHRDLKPENILLDVKSNELVIADLGIAHFSADLLLTEISTKQSDKLFNILYAAPEQRVRGSQVDHRADIFALGKILNEIFTGNVPDGNNYAEIGTINGEYAYLDKVIHKMLQNNPNSRHQSIKEIKLDLLAQKDDFISFQKIHSLRETVVSTTDIDDPLVTNPVTLIDCDPEPLNSRVVLTLNQKVNDTRWHAIFERHRAVDGAERMGLGFKWITDDKLTRPLHQGLNLQSVVDSFKQMLNEINAEYLSNLQKQVKEHEEFLKEDVRKRLHAEEERRRLRNGVKI